MAITKRDFIKRASAVAMASAAASVSSLRIGGLAAASDMMDATPTERLTKNGFQLWASACSHVSGDLNPQRYDVVRIPPVAPHPRESLGEAIRQSEGTNNDGAPSFDWDIAVHLGDFSAARGAPSDEEGEEVVRQFGSLRKHLREDFYCIAGNHDANIPGQDTQWWFRKYIDPLGENPQDSGVRVDKRRYPVEGTWERYSFQVGNILFLMMSDRNDVGPPVGRGEHGGYPAGAVTQETFNWWKNMVENNQDSIIISCHHHMLHETTVASGRWEGLGAHSRKEIEEQWKELYPGQPLGETGGAYHHRDRRYHGWDPGGPEGTSYLYFGGNEPDAQLFETYLQMNPGAIDLWLGGHTHAHPDDQFGDKGHIEKKWGVIFVNVAALTAFHTLTPTPKSRLLSFEPGKKKVNIRCYLHNDAVRQRGWYDPAEETLRLNKSFSWT